jgi:hypothetical protein
MLMDYEHIRMSCLLHTFLGNLIVRKSVGLGYNVTKGAEFVVSL